MKNTTFTLCLIVAIVAGCGKKDGKENQIIVFDNIPPQNLMDSVVTLTAATSSGLPVTFTGFNSNVAIVEGNKARFIAAGVADIVAGQPGDERFAAAPSVSQRLVILDRDPNKKDQTISFELSQTSWKMSQGILDLYAASSSGLPVIFTCNYNWLAAIAGNGFLIKHVDSYASEYVTITASQSGDDEYNPAPNVPRTIHAIHDQ